MCECDVCKEYAKYDKILKFLKFNGEAHVEAFQDLYSRLVHTSMDLDHLQMIVAGNWPSAKDYMKSYGWVKEDSVDEVAAYDYWIGSSTRKGDYIFEGQAKHLTKTLFGNAYKGIDGKVYEIRDTYVKDYARRIKDDK